MEWRRATALTNIDLAGKLVANNAMRLITPAALLAIPLSACSPEPAQEQAQPIEAPIPMMEGHVVHNKLATAQLGLRNLYLSRILRGMGENCMVVSRSMYQGYAKDLGASLWSAHCEIGSEWMISVNKDESGSVLKCDELQTLRRLMERKGNAALRELNCWERFEG